VQTGCAKVVGEEEGGESLARGTTGMGGGLARPILLVLGGGSTTGSRGVRGVVSPWGSLCLSVALGPVVSSLRNKDA
jgi:hypothetical protein